MPHAATPRAPGVAAGAVDNRATSNAVSDAASNAISDAVSRDNSKPKVAPKPTQRAVVIGRKPKTDRGDDDAPRKRVRLKPESPEQLLERLRNPQLSLHEASILLRVSRATVRRYADSGRLGCQRTPGGQRRFFLRDIENFYRQLKLKR